MGRTIVYDKKLGTSKYVYSQPGEKISTTISKQRGKVVGKQTRGSKAAEIQKTQPQEIEGKYTTLERYKELQEGKSLTSYDYYIDKYIKQTQKRKGSYSTEEIHKLAEESVSKGRALTQAEEKKILRKTPKSEPSWKKKEEKLIQEGSGMRTAQPMTMYSAERVSPSMSPYSSITPYSSTMFTGNRIVSTTQVKTRRLSDIFTGIGLGIRSFSVGTAELLPFKFGSGVYEETGREIPLSETVAKEKSELTAPGKVTAFVSELATGATAIKPFTSFTPAARSFTLEVQRGKVSKGITIAEDIRPSYLRRGKVITKTIATTQDDFTKGISQTISTKKPTKSTYGVFVARETGSKAVTPKVTYSESVGLYTPRATSVKGKVKLLSPKKIIKGKEYFASKIMTAQPAERVTVSATKTLTSKGATVDGSGLTFRLPKPTDVPTGTPVSVGPTTQAGTVSKVITTSALPKATTAQDIAETTISAGVSKLVTSKPTISKTKISPKTTAITISAADTEQKVKPTISPKVKTKEIIKPKAVTTTKQVLKPTEKPIQKVTPISPVKPISRLTPTQTQPPTQPLKITPAPPITVTKPVPPTPTPYSPVTPTYFFPPMVLFPILPSGVIFPVRRRKKRGKKGVTGYVPTLGGIFSGETIKKVPKQKVFTGFERRLPVARKSLSPKLGKLKV